MTVQTERADSGVRPPLACTRLLVWMNGGAAVWCIAFWVWTCRSVWRVLLWSCGVPDLHTTWGRRAGVCVLRFLCANLRVMFRISSHSVSSLVCLPARPRPPHYLASTRAEMVGNIRFLTLVKPVLHVLPEVAQPDRKIPFKVRLPA